MATDRKDMYRKTFEMYTTYLFEDTSLVNYLKEKMKRPCNFATHTYSNEIAHPPHKKQVLSRQQQRKYRIQFRDGRTPKLANRKSNILLIYTKILYVPCDTDGYTGSCFHILTPVSV